MTKSSLGALILLALCFPVEARELDKNSAKIEGLARTRGRLIQGELRTGLTSLPAGSGHYVEGDGEGENVDLWLAPRSGFLFEWNGCLGLYDRNFGEVRAVAETVRLHCKLPNHPGAGFQGTATEFVPVAWGQRHYLIATAGLVDFCNAVNAHEEAKYRKYLLDKPIVAHIAATGRVRSVGATGKPSKDRTGGRSAWW